MTVPEIMPKVREYMKKSGDGGGSLHVFLADGNIGDDHIRFCRETAVKEGDGLGVELCDALMTMSKTQRKKVYRNWWKDDMMNDETQGSENVVKFPVKGQQGVVEGPEIPDVIPLTAEMKAQLGIGADGVVRPAVKVMSDGRRYEVTPGGPWKKIGDAPGTIEGRPWNERALKAEALSRGLLEERERCKDRILAACLKLSAGGYSGDDEFTNLVDDPAFIEIEAWAKGVPGDHGPVLLAMRLDGQRAVVRVEASRLVLECGHTVHMENHEGAKLTDMIPCSLCIEMLKARGWFKVRAVVDLESQIADDQKKEAVVTP